MILSEIYLVVVRLYLKEHALIPIVVMFNNIERGDVGESILDNFTKF